MARIGIAISEGSLVLPLEVIPNKADAATAVAAIAAERSVAAIYVGLPLSLSGAHTASTLMAIDFARRVKAECKVPVHMIDERLTSKTAQQRLGQSGKNAKASKGIIDAQAAALILEFALASERGSLAGVEVDQLDV